MKAYYHWLNSLISKNKSEYAEFEGMSWITPYNSAEFQYKRNELLSKLNGTVLFNNTKPFHQQISDGCRICGEGKWSCLFITNKCNAKCFYCPAPQEKDEVPSTQGINFENPSDYADYINHFGFKGVSFSGGEPFLYYYRTLDYLKHIRAKCDKDIYIWLYTNGTLVTEEKLLELSDAGLNEIRFDIGATSFKLDKVKTAKGIIPNVTIEIPAIPEEKEKLISLLPEMVECGITNLNLHQLRLTKHNAHKILNRGYNIIPAEKPIILESELAALEIIDYAHENKIPIGINYCSFFFKNRFQKAGFRTAAARSITGSNTVITENGYIREYSNNSICYKVIRVFNEDHPLMNLKEISLEGKKLFYSEEIILNEKNLGDYYKSEIDKLLSIRPEQSPDDPLLFKIWQLEYIEFGLRNY